MESIKRIIAIVACFVVMCALFSGCNTQAQQSTQPTETLNTVEETKNMFENSIQKSDPGEDDIFNVLLIGNSGFYYFPEELYGVLTAAGFKARVCVLYVGSSTLQQHWTWLRDGEAKYQYHTVDDNGSVRNYDYTLVGGIKQHNWDVIGINDGGMGDHRKGPADRIVDARDEYFSGLISYYRKEFPATKLYWQQNSAYQIGYNKGFTISSVTDQENDRAVFESIAKLVSKRYSIEWVPRGNAAQIARANPVVGDTLTARIGINGDLGDFYHNGDIGGGQYLTACTWFEIITGQGCIGNTYRPDYALSEEKIVALQQAAHEAVMNMDQ